MSLFGTISGIGKAPDVASTDPALRAAQDNTSQPWAPTSHVAFELGCGSSGMRNCTVAPY